MRPTPAKLLEYAKVPYLLVTDLTNIRYLTGISMSSAILLVTPRAFKLYVDPRYAELAEKSQKGFLKACDRADLQKHMQSVPHCGFEEHNVTMATMRRWKKLLKKTKFVRTENIVEHFRRQKDSTEIRLIKKAIAITKELMAMVPTLLKPGVTERGVAWILEARARELGAEKFSFEPIVAFGPHTSRPHHRAGERKLKKGDLVQIDIGVFYKGYSSDMSRVFATGKLTQEQEKAIEAVEKTMEVVLKKAKPGVSAKELDVIAREVLKDYGWDKHMTHALGHGVGLEVHEGVTLAPRDSRPLLKGEVIAIEPGVYFPGKFGVRTEDIVIV